MRPKPLLVTGRLGVGRRRVRGDLATWLGLGLVLVLVLVLGLGLGLGVAHTGPWLSRTDMCMG